MTNTIVNIIFITYNRPKLFPEALNSIQRQTFKNFKVTVIDNGSTPKISLPDNILNDPRFELKRIEKNNQGLATVYNTIKSIKSKYTAFLFDDDRWENKKLEKQISYLEKNDGTIACFTQANFIDENENKVIIPNIFIQKNRSVPEWVFRFFKDGNCLSQPSAVIRTKNLNKPFLFNPYFRLPDLSWWINLLHYGNIHIIEEELVNVGISSTGSNESTINTKEKTNQLIYENSRILLKFRTLPQNVLKKSFLLPPTANQNDIEMAMALKALEFNSEAHFRFAAEVAEENYNIACIANNFQLAISWREVYEKASSQSKIDSNKNFEIKHPLENYNKWQLKRSIIEEEIQVLEKKISRANSVNFHLCIRLTHGQDSALADTIDSLGGQFYPNWHLDIITELPAPEGLNGIPCIGWHNTKIEEQKSLIDTLINQQKYDWCIEIPAGAKLDPLYLWRLSIEIAKNPETRCIFVDDDCFDSSNKSFDPRFKPGCNPSALESSDLAGPICVSRDTWNATGGASESNASPWFSQLLRIAKHYGWNAIQHIPDVLISYPEIFPSNVEACMFSLLEHLDYEKTKTEIIPTTGTSWGFRYQLTPPPKVSIVVISKGRQELLSRCIDSIIKKTIYPANCLEVLIVLNHDDEDLDMSSWLRNTIEHCDLPIKTIRTPSGANKATQSNVAVQSASGEFTLLLDEEVVIIESGWLNDLVGTCAQSGVAGTTPCLIGPKDNTIQQAGLVLGMESISIPFTSTQPGCMLETNNVMQGIAGPLYGRMAMYDHTGYLSGIKMPRDVSVMSGICMLVRTQAYLDVGGMDENMLGDTFADLDLSLKLRKKAWRLIYQPLATIRFGDVTDIQIPAEEIERAQGILKQTESREVFKQRWWPKAAVDSLWSPNLSLSLPNPTPDTNHLATWQYLPLDIPKILAYPVDSGQGIIRINQPVEALRKAGLAQVFLHPQQPSTIPITPAELIRLAPDTVVMHHFFNNIRLPELQSWSTTPGRPFLVFAMDDLITALDETNPFKSNMQPDIRSRLKKALACCDRLVVSTDYLGNTCANLISDILVVPNFIEQDVWLPLRSQRRTSSKPRIGWAGGTSHQGDLVLLKEIIEQTRHEADWVFFGMCPDEIKPLLAEFHPPVSIDQYPSYLASLNLDIAVAPLAQTPFNFAKSNLRLQEYGILSLPVVCTDITPYQNSPACRVPNTPSAWIAALRERIHDADAREQEGRSMREWVIKNHLLESNLDAWLSAHLPT